VTAMRSKGKNFLLAAGVLASMLGGARASAQPGGGGGHAGGAGHAAGGGHAGGGFAGGIHGGGAHGPGAGAHFAPGAHYAGGVRGFTGTGYAHGYPAGYAHGYPAGYRGAAVYHGGYGYGHAAYYGHGYSTGAYWRGGYWHGGFWPRAYYGVGFAWYLPVLPLAYATYWYGGIPYYYANDVYYTYNPSYEGYVATDPPPAADGGGAEGAAPSADAMAPNGAPADAAMAGQIFMYPKNGQSAEQQATDKAECQQWAAQEAGQVAQNGADYRRAMTACVEGRGYSAK
jgi:hypothetical protein